MDYLIAEIFVCLVLAFALGCVIGWLLKGVGSKRREAELAEQIAALKTATVADSDPDSDPESDPESDPDPDPEQAASAPEVQSPQGAAVAATVATATAAASVGAKVEATSYEVEEVDGIGPGYGRRLREIGLDSTTALLERCQSPEDMASIAEHCGIEHFAVQKWAYMADLLRVPGVRGPYAELLVFAGIDTVQDLASRKASTLAGELTHLNAQEQRIEDVPNVATLEDWVSAAAQLPVKLEQ